MAWDPTKKLWLNMNDSTAWRKKTTSTCSKKHPLFRCALASLYEGLSVLMSIRMSVHPSVGISVRYHQGKNTKIAQNHQEIDHSLPTLKNITYEHLRFIYSNEIKYLKGASLSAIIRFLFDTHPHFFSDTAWACLLPNLKNACSRKKASIFRPQLFCIPY